jgi:hypothetical protein
MKEMIPLLEELLWEEQPHKEKMPGGGLCDKSLNSLPLFFRGVKLTNPTHNTPE